MVWWSFLVKRLSPKCIDESGNALTQCRHQLTGGDYRNTEFLITNPSTYVDTLAIIGTKSLLFPIDQRLIFGMGAILASAFWFFTLAFGASKLSPIFRSKVAWRMLDVISGCIMLVCAITMFAVPHL